MSRKQKYEGINRKKQIVYAVWVNKGDLSYVYVGSGYYERLIGNGSKLRRNKHDNKELQAAYNKAGEYKIEIIYHDLDSRAIARDIEDEYKEYYAKLDGVIVCNHNQPYVEPPYKRKLCEDDVLIIRDLIKQGKSNKEICEIYNISSSMVSRIKTGKRWEMYI
ncbi:hypothetical protein [Clostridium scatologenes]|uniref:GIY-YIG domain-containing protein n=1 Tax=Clostridium scatologenes TaxID=1548 RepID=A0A0E3JRV2_CLOSL|nr:hypothetical protein [Clostridium scatologenes]AKA71954.1 hypothetical protein CSCA_4829 [Clostridium scatologenes]